MPRTEARIHTSIWDDDDFVALPPLAQWMYTTLLSQDDLMLCGVMPFRPARWAKCAAGVTAATVNKLIRQLEAPPGRFVVVDRDTGELLVRTFMKHDGVLTKPNVFKGAASSVRQVDSDLILDEIPKQFPPQLREGWPDVYRTIEPKILGQIMRNASTEPTTEPLPGTLPPTDAEPPSSVLHPPTSSLQPPTSKSSSSGQHQQPDPQAVDDDPGKAARRTAIVEAVVDRRCAGRQTATGEPPHARYRQAVATQIEAAMGDRITTYANDPAVAELDPATIAEHLDLGRTVTRPPLGERWATR